MTLVGYFSELKNKKIKKLTIPFISLLLTKEIKKKMFYLTIQSIPFIHAYMAMDINKGIYKKD